MGYKLVCVSCRTSFSVGNDLMEIKNKPNCRNCGKHAKILHHKFKPPKKTDKKAWERVRLLIENGFDFSSEYVGFPDEKSPIKMRVQYPETLEETKEFIQKRNPK